MKNTTSFIKIPFALLNKNSVTPYNFNLYQLEASGHYRVLPQLIVESKEFNLNAYKTKRQPLFISKEDKNAFIEFIGLQSGGLGDGFSKDQIKEAGALLSPFVEMVCAEICSHLPVALRDQFMTTENVLKQTVQDIASEAQGLSLMLRLFCSHDYLVTHSFLVSSLSFLLANDQGYSAIERKSVAQGALLHDIGMLRIDEEVYIKPKLDENDWQIMKAHPLIGEKMLSQLSHLHPIVMDIIAGHHSQPNGRGYGRAGTELAHLVGTIDAFSTMIIPTPYRSLPFSPQEAWNSLREDEGHFDRGNVELIKDILIQPHLKKAS